MLQLVLKDFSGFQGLPEILCNGHATKIEALIRATGVALAWFPEGKRAAKRDDLSHGRWSFAGEAAGVDSTEAPADHANRGIVA